MAVEKKIIVDGKEVLFKASAAIPRIYRNKYKRDIFVDLSNLSGKMANSDPEKSSLDGISLGLFEDIAFIMAKHADQSIPDSVDEWLDQFGVFSIYQVLPELLDLWGMNTAQIVESKKK